MPEAVGEPVLDVPRERLLPFRVAQSHLKTRLPARSFRDAAWGALQDSSPRAALISLHARMEGAAPDSWEDPSLWQIWLRMSDYVVPREDFGVFTLGALPRDPQTARALIETGDAVAEILGGRTLPARELGAALGRRPGMNERTRLHGWWVVREACVSGRYRIRWDARSVTVTAAPVPDIDPEDARRELVRRFLHWHGPATPRQFATWAHVPLVDALETWRRLATELLPVTVDARTRHILARDEDALREEPRVGGARLVPLSDPAFALDRPLSEAPAGPGHHLTGRILVDGQVAGAWGRREHRVSIWMWGRPATVVQERVLAEAETLAGPIGRPVEIDRLT